jgi:hypothetical protein
VVAAVAARGARPLRAAGGTLLHVPPGFELLQIAAGLFQLRPIGAALQRNPIAMQTATQQAQQAQQAPGMSLFSSQGGLFGAVGAARALQSAPLLPRAPQLRLGPAGRLLGAGPQQQPLACEEVASCTTSAAAGAPRAPLADAGTTAVAIFADGRATAAVARGQGARRRGSSQRFRCEEKAAMSSQRAAEHVRRARQMFRAGSPLISQTRGAAATHRLLGAAASHRQPMPAPVNIHSFI